MRYESAAALAEALNNVINDLEPQNKLLSGEPSGSSRLGTSLSATTDNSMRVSAVNAGMSPNAANAPKIKAVDNTGLTEVVIVDKVEIRKAVELIEGKGRLDMELANSMSSKKANDFVNVVMASQKSIDMKHFEDLQMTKTNYTNQLTSQKSIMEGHGQTSMAKILEEELFKLVGTENDFENYIK